MTVAAFQSMGAKELLDVVQQLENAIEEHNRWLQAWHRAVICGLPANPDDLREDAHHRCHFGRWYYAHSQGGLFDHGAFAELGAQHRRMHDHARQLAAKAVARDVLTGADYDGFLAEQNAFAALLTRMRDEALGYRYMVDVLTDVPGRRGVIPAVRQEQQRALRNGQPCCIALLDLDGFKQVNDTFGHAGGDQVLYGAAQFFKRHMRLYDVLFRYGGEEFLVCLPNTGLDAAQGVLERLREGLEGYAVQLAGGATVGVTTSIGVTALDPAEDPEAAIGRADQALYAAKQAGRNRIVAAGT